MNTDDASRIASSLIAAAQPPRNVAELEAALGVRFEDSDLELGGMGSFTPRRELSPIVQSLSATYGWDMYHEHPVDSVNRLRTRRLIEFTVGLKRGRAAVEAALQQRFGPPREVAGQRAYDRWFVREGRGDGCALAHYDKMPDWAVPAADPPTRARFLRELVAVAAASDALEPIQRAAGQAPPAAGVQIASLWPGDAGSAHLTLELVPPMRARELAEALGWSNAIGQSSDVHMSSWSVRLVTGATEYGPSTAPPHYGNWNLVASLDRQPTGGEVPGHRPGPIGRQRLGSDDTVRYLRIGVQG